MKTITNRGLRIQFLASLIFAIGGTVACGLPTNTGFLDVAPATRTIKTSSLPLALQWVYSAPSQIRTPPVAKEGSTIVGTGGKILVIDSATGQEVWSYETGCSKPLLQLTKGDLIIFPANNCHELQAFDLKQKRAVWNQIPETSNPGRISALLGQDDTFFVVQAPAPITLRAYETETGRLLWDSKEKFPSRGFQNLFLIGNELFVFVANDLYVIDSKDGNTIRQVSGKFPNGAQLVSESHAIVSKFGSIESVELATGESRWKFEPTCALRQNNSTYMTLKGDRLYVAGNCSTLYSLNSSDGTIADEIQLPTDAVSSPAFAAKTGYIMLRNGSLFAFDVDSGLEVGRLETEPSSTNQFYLEKGLEVDNGKLLATFGDRQLFSFGK